MIEFYKDNLVPSELCRLLYEAVPKDYHVPVRFYNRWRKDVHGKSGYPRGSVRIQRGKQPSHININLNPLFADALSSEERRAHAPTSSVWRLLVEVCLHEFGHVATQKEMFRMNQHEYHAEGWGGRVYNATEDLADDWRDRRIAKILRTDSRLGQPRYMSGYLGARLIKWKKVVKDAPGYYPFIVERRCQMTGGQLTAGDVLRKLNVQHLKYTNAYALLREASKGIGVDYVDRAGRHHKLYTWGDVPLIAERFDRVKLREIDQERAFERAMQKFLQEEMAGSLAT